MTQVDLRVSIMNPTSNQWICYSFIIFPSFFHNVVKPIVSEGYVGCVCLLASPVSVKGKWESVKTRMDFVLSGQGYTRAGE